MLQDTITTYKRKITNLTNYMRLKIDEQDWHAVADAAMDIREYEAKIDLAKAILASDYLLDKE